MSQVICPECKARWAVGDPLDLPRAHRHIYCEFCQGCRDGVYRYLFLEHYGKRESTWKQKLYKTKRRRVYGGPHGH